MRAIFLADAHLRNPTDSNYRMLVSFLKGQTGKTDILVFLGDIFEFWIGKDKPAPEHANFIDLLEEMTRQGTKLVYVEGNHDFHLGPVFTKRLNCQVLPDGGKITIDDHTVYLAHGDLANPGDHGYLRLRKFLRSSFIRTLIRTLPNQILKGIAYRASHESRKNGSERKYRWPAREILKSYAEGIIAAGHDVVITAHFHQPFHEKLGDGELIALGDWISQFSYAIYEDQAFTLTEYHPAVLAAG